MPVIDRPILKSQSRPTAQTQQSPGRRVAIRGVGLVTPLGASASETWDALIGGQFIKDHARCVAGRSLEHAVGSEICVGSASADRLLPADSNRVREIHAATNGPRIFQLALRAAREALVDGVGPLRQTLSTFFDSRTALIVGTSKGNVESWMSPDPTPDTPATLSDLEDGKFGLADLAAMLADELRIAGPCLTLSGACASSLQALIRGVIMIRSGDADRVLVVAAESSLHPLFLGSFKRLGVLARPGDRCRPFDQRRSGFLMSEGAAAVLLESDSIDRSSSATDVRIENVCLAGDSAHLTAGDPTGRVLRYVLDHVIDGRPVDLIHAHATGTVVNDPIELASIAHAVGNPTDARLPSIYSHKGAIGHSLGAAGLSAIVLNTLMHARGVILPNVQTRSPLDSTGVTIAAEPVERRINRSVALAAGFGGACAAVSMISAPK